MASASSKRPRRARSFAWTQRQSAWTSRSSVAAFRKRRLRHVGVAGPDLDRATDEADSDCSPTHPQLLEDRVGLGEQAACLVEASLHTPEPGQDALDAGFELAVALGLPQNLLEPGGRFLGGSASPVKRKRKPMQRFALGGAVAGPTCVVKRSLPRLLDVAGVAECAQALRRECPRPGLPQLVAGLLKDPECSRGDLVRLLDEALGRPPALHPRAPYTQVHLDPLISDLHGFVERLGKELLAAFVVSALE